jgi:hypothetical protein
MMAESLAQGDNGPKAAPSSEPLNLHWGAAAVVLVCATYLLMWWDRFLSPTMGHELFFYNQFRHGRMPYRDYYFAGPPGNQVLAILVFSWLGERLTTYWLVSMAIRLAAVGCLFRWLARVYRPAGAALGSITAFVVASGDIADYPGFYNHLVLSYIVFGSYAASRILESPSASGRFGWGTVAGLFLSLNFLCKQTTGVVVTLAVLAIVSLAVARTQGIRQAIGALAAMLLGLAVPVLGVWLWLFGHGVFGRYVDQVFLTGPTSKGRLSNILARPVLLTLEYSELWTAAILGLLTLGGLFLLTRLGIQGRPGESDRRWPWELVAAGGGLLALSAGGMWYLLHLDSHTPLLAAVYFSLVGCLALGVAALGQISRGARDPVDWQRVLLAGVGFSCAYALSLSWPAWEPMAFPGLAVLVAVLFNAIPKSEARTPVLRPVLTVLCLVLLAVACWRKFSAPFSWGYWSEPPISAGRVSPSVAALQGLRLSPETAHFFDEVTRLIRANSDDGEAIFIYPHMQIFFALADRPPATYAFMHWYDVCPDSLAEQDAERLEQSPPAVMVCMEITAEENEMQERFYREGRPSGQRQLVAAMARLLPKYDLVGEFIAPKTRLPIKVWARRKAAAPKELGCNRSIAFARS